MVAPAATVLTQLDCLTNYEKLAFYGAIKRLVLIASLALCGCVTTAAELGQSRVEKTLQSEKSAADFAMCVAENTLGAAELRNDGTRYWVLVNDPDGPRIRWDFIPTETGSIAELRTFVLLGKQSFVGEGCR